MNNSNSKSRDSFIFYRSFYESISELPSKDRLEIYEAIASFSLDFIEPELVGIPKAIFALIKPNLEANNKRWESGSKAKRKRNGSETEANKDKDKDKDKDNKKKTVRFIPPTDKELLEYIGYYAEEKGKQPIDAERFLDFYTSKGWMVGKTKMKDWKASVRSWFKDQPTKKDQPEFYYD